MAAFACECCKADKELKDLGTVLCACANERTCVRVTNLDKIRRMKKSHSCRPVGVSELVSADLKQFM